MKRLIFALLCAFLMMGTSCKKTELESAHEHAPPNVETYAIGSWDMDADNNVAIAHGLDCDLIESVSVIVVNDDGIKIDLMSGGSGAISFDETNVYVGRFIGSPFDSENFDDPGIDRGTITIEWG